MTGNAISRRRLRARNVVPGLGLVTCASLTELRSVSDDLKTILAALTDLPSGMQLAEDENRFFASLTGDQLQSARAPEGLPLGMLAPSQRSVFLNINTAQGYGSLIRANRTAVAVFHSWERCIVRAGQDAQGAQIFWLDYPDPTHRDRKLHLAVSGAIAPASAATASPAGQVLETTGPPAIPPFDRPFDGPDGNTSLNEIVAAIEKATGAKLIVTKDAGSRPLCLYADRAQCRQVISLVESVLGLELKRRRKGVFALDRRRVRPAKNAKEVHELVSGAVPPIVARLLHRESDSSWSQRAGRQMASVLGAIGTRTTRGSEGAQISSLPQKQQDKLATLVFEKLYRAELRDWVQRPNPLQWLVSPETGVLHLRGSAAEGKHPLVDFRVTRPDGGYDAWGWYVGTSQSGNR